MPPYFYGRAKRPRVVSYFTLREMMYTPCLHRSRARRSLTPQPCSLDSILSSTSSAAPRPVLTLGLRRASSLSFSLQIRARETPSLAANSRLCIVREATPSDRCPNIRAHTMRENADSRTSRLTTRRAQHALSHRHDTLSFLSHQSTAADT